MLMAVSDRTMQSSGSEPNPHRHLIPIIHPHRSSSSPFIFPHLLLCPSIHPSITGEKPGGATKPAGRMSGGSGRRAAMMRKKRQAEAERTSGHVMHALAQQLRETFTQSGMTPELLFNT